MKIRKTNSNGDVNKYNCLNFDSYNHDIIKISKILSHIDRIQFSVKHYPLTYPAILNRLEKDFGHGITKKMNKKLIVIFNEGSVSIQVVKYLNFSNQFAEQWFALSVSNPNNKIQKYFAKLFHDLFVNPESTVSLSQVEFAIDYYPENPNDLYDLNMLFQNMLVLRFSREKSSGKYRETFYQGKNANVRKGSKGLRIYPKEEHGKRFARVELMVKRPFLKKNDLDITSLPICPDKIDIYSQIDFKSGLIEKTQGKIVNSLMNQLFKKTVRQNKFPDKYQKSKSIKYKARRAAQCRLANFIYSDIGNTPPEYFPYDYDHRLAADQINKFKKMKRDYGLTMQVSVFFPKLNKQVISDLQKGFIYRRYIP